MHRSRQIFERMIAPFSGRSMSRFKSFLQKEEDGATAVEFAMIAAPFFACIGFVLMAGFMFLTATSLEEGVKEAGRQIRVGKVASSNMSKNDFRDYICQFVALAKADCQAKLVIDVDSAPTVTGLPTDTPHTGGALDASKSTFDPGKGEEYVLVKAYLPINSLQAFFKLLGVKDASLFTVSSATAFRSEPF